MPVYEYLCRSCRRRTDILSHTFQAPINPTCSHCGSGDTERAITTFAILKSEKTRQEEAEMGLDMPEGFQGGMDQAMEGGMDDLLEGNGF